ncbi:hypothetical protein Ddc_20658 [Ditylenchus destructor]|nr:hypothetical protein Ddc_20658 [Ditylenchus destructor]
MKAKDKGYTVPNQMENDRNRIDAAEMKRLQDFALGLSWQLKVVDQKIQAANEFRNQAVQKEWSAFETAQYAKKQLMKAEEEQVRAQRDREVAEHNAKKAAERKAKLHQHLGKVNQQIADKSKPTRSGVKPTRRGVEYVSASTVRDSKPTRRGVEYVSASTVRHPPRRHEAPYHKATCRDCARNEQKRRNCDGHRKPPEVGGRG